MIRSERHGFLARPAERRLRARTEASDCKPPSSHRQLQLGSWRPLRAAVRDAQHLHEVERAGESEWTPWIAILGLILFFATVGLLMLGAAEAAYYLIA
jgi:hypothetical protein